MLDAFLRWRRSRNPNEPRSFPAPAGRPALTLVRDRCYRRTPIMDIPIRRASRTPPANAMHGQFALAVQKWILPLAFRSGSFHSTAAHAARQPSFGRIGRSIAPHARTTTGRLRGSMPRGGHTTHLPALDTIRSRSARARVPASINRCLRTTRAGLHAVGDSKTMSAEHPCCRLLTGLDRDLQTDISRNGDPAFPWRVSHPSLGRPRSRFAGCSPAARPISSHRSGDSKRPTRTVICEPLDPSQTHWPVNRGHQCSRSSLTCAPDHP